MGTIDCLGLLIDTSVLNGEEKMELQGTSITKEDLDKYPNEVKDVARFSISTKLSSRASLDVFIRDGNVSVCHFK